MGFAATAESGQGAQDARWWVRRRPLPLPRPPLLAHLSPGVWRADELAAARCPASCHAPLLARVSPGNPLPRVVHAVLPEATTRHRRVVILGDVHGCPAELQRLLDRLEYRKGVDVLLSVGDLVNKGPDSPEVTARVLLSTTLGARPHAPAPLAFAFEGSQCVARRLA